MMKRQVFFMSTPVQSLDRVLDIVELLSTFPQGLALSDLADQVGLHISTAHRLVGALVSRGYAIKDPQSGKYRLTFRMFEVGSRIVSGANIVSVARPFLEYLAAVAGETVHLSVRDKDEVVYLYKDSHADLTGRMASFVGLRSPMYCTAMGKSILALLPETEVRTIWSRTQVVKLTANTICTYGAMQRELELTAQRGYAVDNEEHETGVYCIAAAITNFNHQPVGAISISSPISQMDEARKRQLSQHIREAAISISTLLGA
ncbi:MAG: IclR family transcriptional regulator [Ruminococcaceae bacterium]|nr:IclR family transcriptional regulator [Oscillospiraceae bacterium]